MARNQDACVAEGITAPRASTFSAAGFFPVVGNVAPFGKDIRLETRLFEDLAYCSSSGSDVVLIGMAGTRAWEFKGKASDMNRDYSRQGAPHDLGYEVPSFPPGTSNYQRIANMLKIAGKAQHNGHGRNGHNGYGH